MSAWNFADAWEVVAETLPDAPALIHGDRRQNWAATDARANGIAATLLGSGARHQDKVAHYLFNCPEYLESTFAMFKAGLVPVNTNYRYGSEELAYLWDNADAVGVVFHAGFAGRIEEIRPRLHGIRSWLWVADGSGETCPPWATPYEDAASCHEERVTAPWRRGPDDLYILYTGGTTGYPKGVMWRQDDLFASLNAASFLHFPDDGGLEGIRSTLNAPGAVHLPACPLMHGTGALSAFNAWNGGGSVVTLTNHTFDPAEMLDAIQENRVNSLAIVGDAFAKPMLRALDADPGRWDISSLFLIVSSGVMWSEETKQGLHRHHPGMLLVDTFSSSEALGMGTSVSASGSEIQTARFSLGDSARVIGEDGRNVIPGTAEIGMLAVGGRNPVGYYKDPEKSASTFRVIDGKRYSIPGDYATVDSDGTIHLLGRGSVVVNTGGEKVFPEEVEEAIKSHPLVHDAVVLGVPDERFGEAICALVETQPGADLRSEDIVEQVQARLARFKAPRHVVFVKAIDRAPNGKVDYEQLRSDALQQLGL